MMLSITLCLLTATPLLTQDEEKKSGPEPEVHSFGRDHTLQLPSGPLNYRSVAETTLLENKDGEPEAEFFSISYFASDTGPERPITFAFNGGPGSASVWLHLGLLGPRLVQVPDDGQPAGAPPYPMVDNPKTLLAVSDLVFVDPIGTGLSRIVGEGDADDHWGVDEDARSVARFIREFLTNKERWASPKYVLGESYGGIRGPLLVRELQSGFNSCALNGLILISPACDMELVDGQTNDAAYATVLPTYAATAWYHKALPEPRESLEAFLSEVRTFAAREYVPALFVGRDLPPAERQAILDKLHLYTGLSKQYIDRANLKVGTNRFRRELLRDRGLVVGRLDTRYTGTEEDNVGEVPTGDPMGSGISGAYVSAFNHYLRTELGVRTGREYKVMSSDAYRGWNRPDNLDGAFHGYVDVMPHIARGMSENPDLRMFIANGYYDIATTFYAAEYNVARSTMDRSRVVIENYPAGHMMYVHQETLEKLCDDLLHFVAAPQ